MDSVHFVVDRFVESEFVQGNFDYLVVFVHYMSSVYGGGPKQPSYEALQDEPRDPTESGASAQTSSPRQRWTICALIVLVIGIMCIPATFIMLDVEELKSVEVNRRNFDWMHWGGLGSYPGVVEAEEVLITSEWLAKPWNISFEAAEGKYEIKKTEYSVDIRLNDITVEYISMRDVVQAVATKGWLWLRDNCFALVGVLHAHKHRLYLEYGLDPAACVDNQRRFFSTEGVRRSIFSKQQQDVRKVRETVAVVGEGIELRPGQDCDDTRCDFVFHNQLSCGPGDLIFSCQKGQERHLLDSTEYNMTAQDVEDINNFLNKRYVERRAIVGRHLSDGASVYLDTKDAPLFVLLLSWLGYFTLALALVRASVNAVIVSVRAKRIAARSKQPSPVELQE